MNTDKCNKKLKLDNNTKSSYVRLLCTGFKYALYKASFVVVKFEKCTLSKLTSQAYMHISAIEKKLLKELNDAFINPFRYEKVENWLGLLNQKCRELTQAEKSTFFLPDQNTLHYYSEDTDPDAIDVLKNTVLEIPHSGDLLISDDLLRRGHLARRRMPPMVMSFDSFESMFLGADVSEYDIYNEVIFPGGIAFPIGMGMPLKSGETVMSMLFSKRPQPEVIEKAILLMNNALPSFVCGVHGYLALSAVRSGLFSIFDSFKEGIVVVTTDNDPVYSNKSWQKYLADEDTRELLEAFVHNLGNVQLTTLHKRKKNEDFPPSITTLKTNTAVYRAEILYLPEQSLGKLYLAIRVFRDTTGIVRSSANYYSLSRRECEVAEYLIRGESNKSIAQQLFISEFTVRRHVESILCKLQISSRAAVLPTLLKVS